MVQGTAAGAGGGATDFAWDPEHSAAAHALSVSYTHLIMVEQHVQLALEVADEAMVLVHGSIVLSGPAEIYRDDVSAVQSAYMSGSVSTS